MSNLNKTISINPHELLVSEISEFDYYTLTDDSQCIPITCINASNYDPNQIYYLSSNNSYAYMDNSNQGVVEHIYGDNTCGNGGTDGSINAIFRKLVIELSPLPSPLQAPLQLRYE